MFNEVLNRLYFAARRFLLCKKGTSNELLTAIGLISITVGVLSVVSPTIRTTIQQVTTDALNAAATLFRTTTGGR
jgi:hypothetical protein